MKLREIAQQKYVLLGDNCFMEQLRREDNNIFWKVGRLMQDEPIGEASQLAGPHPSMHAKFYDGQVHDKRDENALDIRWFKQWLTSVLPRQAAAPKPMPIVKIDEMWSDKPTDIWLHRLNKDGSESGSRDARRYYVDKARAVEHHNHMVDANPGKTIAHHLHMKTELGRFKLKLVGKQTAKGASKKARSLNSDVLAKMMDLQGSAASAWMPDSKLDELLAIYNAGGEWRSVRGYPKDDEEPKDWADKKVKMMESKGYKLLASHMSPAFYELIFTRD